MTWDEAMNKFKDDKEGWRLPTIQELGLMYEHKKELNMDDAWYWSGSEINHNGARLQYFDDGYQDWYLKVHQGRVRCVRSVK